MVGGAKADATRADGAGGDATDAPAAARAWPGSRHRRAKAVGEWAMAPGGSPVTTRSELMPRAAADREVSPFVFILS